MKYSPGCSRFPIRYASDAATHSGLASPCRIGRPAAVPRGAGSGRGGSAGSAAHGGGPSRLRSGASVACCQRSGSSGAANRGHDDRTNRRPSRHAAAGPAALGSRHDGGRDRILCARIDARLACGRCDSRPIASRRFAERRRRGRGGDGPGADWRRWRSPLGRRCIVRHRRHAVRPSAALHPERDSRRLAPGRPDARAGDAALRQRHIHRLALANHLCPRQDAHSAARHRPYCAACATRRPAFARPRQNGLPSGLRTQVVSRQSLSGRSWCGPSPTTSQESGSTPWPRWRHSAIPPSRQRSFSSSPTPTPTCGSRRPLRSATSAAASRRGRSMN